MEGPISFWGYKEQESNLILLKHDDDEICRNSVIKIKVLFESDKHDGYFTWTSTYIYDNISVNSS